MAREYVIRKVAPAKKIDFAGELNQQQYEAVTSPPGPALVLAGAGSGKTRTLTYRVAYLLENGVDPGQILLLTFTNKAAREMVGRVSELVSQDVSGLWGGTFHSVGSRILRRHPIQAGYREGFTVLDREDAEEILQSVLLGLEGGKVVDLPMKPKVAADVLGYAVNVQKPLKDVILERYTHLEDFTALLEKVQEGYQRRKKESNALDFDDLLLRSVELLEKEESIAERYQKQFQFVLVDEYQDTNPLQSRFIDVLSRHYRNLMVVGDDAQAIYSWRGADYRNILSFEKRYPGARVYRVETNYRSIPQVLELANATLKSMEGCYPKVLRAHREGGELPKLLPLQSGNHQARFVVSRMMELSELGVGWDEMAVLYRAHFHSMELQMEMTRAGIPFRITSGLRFFEQAHVKDVSAFLKFAVNPHDEVAFKRVARLLPGVGSRTADGLWQSVREIAERVMWWRETGQGFAVDLGEELMRLKVPAKAKGAWTQLGHTLAELCPEGKVTTPLKMLQSVREALYDDYARVEFPDYENRKEDLNTLGQFAMQYEDAQEFLDQMALLGDMDGGTKDEEEEMVTLSSVHQAKGLEWKVVFVLWLTEGMFPSGRSMQNPQAFDEERRLFYVAVTRAEDELYLSWPLIRRGMGSGETLQRISPFLEEIPVGLMEEWSVSGGW